MNIIIDDTYKTLRLDKWGFSLVIAVGVALLWRNVKSTEMLPVDGPSPQQPLPPSTPPSSTHPPSTPPSPNASVPSLRTYSLSETLLDVLDSSAVLQSVLPKVRRLAITETIHLATDQVAVQVLLENLFTSPFIPEGQKDVLAELVLSEQWGELLRVLQCNERRGRNYGVNRFTDDFNTFRSMVVAIYSRSRKVSMVDPVRRRHIGAAIYTASSIDELKALTIQSLETSDVFDDDSRELVANDMLDNRFDLLLLPDRFDCEEVQRVNVGGGERSQSADDTDSPGTSEEEIECGVCLGSEPVSIKLPCAHSFCHTCITQWAERHERSSFPCPMCRAETNATTVLVAVR